MRRRLSADLVIVALVLALFVVVNVHLARDASRVGATLELLPNASVDNSGPSGTKAFFRLLQKLGFQVMRHEKEWPELPAKVGLFAVFQPEPWKQPLEAEEVKWVCRWVKQGNVLLIVDSESNPLLEELGFRIKYLNEAKPRVYSLKQPSVYAKGAKRIKLAATARIKSSELPYLEHLGDAEGPVVVSSRYGKGRVVIVTDPGVFNNGRIGQDDNSVLAVNISAVEAGANFMAIDERHHIMPRKITILDLIKRPPASWVALQLLMALILLLYSQGKRFGAPVPLPAGPKERAGSEFVEAMANLHQRAEAGPKVMEELYQGFRQSLSERLGIPVQAPDEMVADYASRRGIGERKEVLGLLASCQEAMSSAGLSDSRLLSLSMSLEKLRRDLLPNGYHSSRSN